MCTVQLGEFFIAIRLTDWNTYKVIMAEVIAAIFAQSP